MPYDADNQFSPRDPRYSVTSMMCRGGLVEGTEHRHAACPRDLGHIPLLDDETYKCDCPCHRIGFPIPALPSGRMNAEDAAALIQQNNQTKGE